MARPLRIAHLADTHIGMENYGRLNPETGLNQRLHDFLNSLDQAIDAALQAEVDLVLFAGDIYKTRDPTPTHQREFATRIRRLSAAGVHTMIVAGNHDIPLSSGRATSVDVFKALEVDRVTTARVLGTHQIDTKSGPIQIVAFPWPVRSMVLSHPDYKNLSIGDLNQVMIDLTAGRLKSEAAHLEPGVPAIVVGHAHLFGARIGAERLLTMGNDPMYDPQAFDLPGVDYVALGHIHKHQALRQAPPPIVYAGSIDRVDFGEEGEDKGWVYVEIGDKGHAEWEFHKIAARSFLTIDAKSSRTTRPRTSCAPSCVAPISSRTRSSSCASTCRRSALPSCARTKSAPSSNRRTSSRRSSAPRANGRVVDGAPPARRSSARLRSKH